MSTTFRAVRQTLLATLMGGLVAVLFEAALPDSSLGSETAPAAPAARIELSTLRWSFEQARPATSTLEGDVDQAALAAPDDPQQGFTVKLALATKRVDADTTVLVIPDVLHVRLRRHDPSDRHRQNYPAFTMPDGSVPVLEATVTLHSDEHPDWNNMTIGIPLAMLDEPEGEHDVVLNFSGARWSMYVDGEHLDNDFPFGYPRWPARGTWQRNPAYVEQASLHVPAIDPTKEAAKPEVAPVQYWTPPGHNTWVGDVATIFHEGRYHVFYLFDRRHHHSKFVNGAHYFEHLSTADFTTWTEHEAATPLEEQWECIGTGTPFVADGRLCLAYGLHTERIYPDEKTTLPAQRDYLAAHGHTGTFDRTTPGAPIGATYAVSADGVADFRKTWKVFHPCRNPSVYRAPSGRLRMLANHHGKGTWESESVDGGWRCLNPNFPPGGDCTFFFHWGRFDYVIGGFRNLWIKPAGAPDSEYDDLASQGLDFYDGLNVPAISQIGDGRFLMAGWTTIRGWGGNLVIRELLQYPDGRIGAKWLDDIMPETEQPETLARRIAAAADFPVDGQSFLLTGDVVPEAGKEGQFAVSFLPETGERASCQWQLRLDERRAQFGPGMLTGFGGPQKSLREGGSPHHGGNYAIENLVGVDRPFHVRVLVIRNDKIGGSLIDTEIAGQRTMLSYRPELTVEKLVFRTDGADLENVRCHRLRVPH